MTKLKLITSNLIQDLSKLSTDATSIYWLSAFAMKSGVELVLPFLKEALARGAEVKILVGDYLYITQPKALALLIEELPHAEIRLYKSSGISFHPKAYLFRSAKENHLIVGSSNLSRSVLKNGVEWNLYAPTVVNDPTFDEASAEFLRLFYAEQTMALNQESIKRYTESFQMIDYLSGLLKRW